MPVFPGGGLDDHGTGLQQSLASASWIMERPTRVLGGAGGIQVFQLGQHLGGEAVPGSIPLQSQQGGVSDQLFHAVRDL